ncbi:alpha-2-macroglobulin family protein [Crateriforma conspicua]
MTAVSIRRIAFASASLLSAFLLMASLGMTQDEPSDPQAQWQAVQQAINQGRPKTAIEKLDPIVRRAAQNKQYDEWIKAVTQRIVLQGTIQGNKPEEKITRMQTQIDEAPDEVRPILQAIVANWYWHYFQQNRWRFLQRTETETAPSEDFTEWSLPRILREIDRHFDLAFENTDQLKAAKVEQYEQLLDNHDRGVNFRPTLYDVLVHNALEFYSSGTQAGNQIQDAFVLSADDPIFDTTERFLAWTPDTSDEDSLLLRSIQLYQDLLRFHADDESPDARLDADLGRLSFGNNHAQGDDKTQRYQSALERFIEDHRGETVTARAIHELAQIHFNENDRVTAHRLCIDALEDYPDSIGANRCFNLLEQIRSKSLHIEAERVWADPVPPIHVRYQNITKVHFKLVEFDFDAFVNSDRYRPMQIDDDFRDALLSMPAVSTWEADLTDHGDFRQHSRSVDVPEGIAAGSYYLLASQTADFAKSDNQLSIAEVWVSDLALVIRDDNRTGRLSGFVLDAKSGEPIRGASVRSWMREPPTNRFRPLRTVRSDANGLFQINAADRNSVMLLASHDGNRLSSHNYFNTRRVEPNHRTNESTQFFTDRSLYRPGQTIRFKGICLSVQQHQDQYKVLKNRSLSVTLSDPNGKEVETLKVRTNDYGSFSGSFTAPRDRLTGRMTVRVVDGPRGQANINVEEYKRPKFQVELEPQADQASLNQVVTATGKATAYTGAAINDAKVTWRVVRSVNYPVWWYWRCWWMPPQSSSQEIAHGTSMTDGSGRFEIEFTAKPDASVAKDSEPTFRYEIHADVTDTTGETRSDKRTISLGYTSLAASMTADDWLTADEPVSIRIRTTSLDGQPQAATGTVKIHRLVQPDQVTRQSLTRAPDPFSPPALFDEGETKSPDEIDPTNPNSWPLGDVVAETEFETNASGQTTFKASLDAGIYRAVLTSRDDRGNEISALHPMQVLDLDAKQLDIRLPEIYQAKSWSVEVGEDFQVFWGSGYEQARAFVEIEHRGKVLKSFWTPADRTQALIEQKVEPGMRGGFTIRTTMVRENRAFLHSNTVSVPWSNKNLSIRWEHFVSKLSPAEKQTWTAIIEGPDAERAAAEMVATLYDVSLDAYQPHQWLQRFSVFRRDGSSVRSYFQNHNQNLQVFWNDWTTRNRDGSLVYPSLAGELVHNFMGYQFMRGRMMRGGMGGAMGRSNMFFGAAPQAAPMAASPEMADAFGMDDAEVAEGAIMSKASAGMGGIGGGGEAEQAPQPDIDLSGVQARKNLNETAFFFPHLTASDDGTVRMEFTMPEALTEWKFMGFAHDTELASGGLIDSVVTSKDLMIQPNPPRFLREGDQIEFTVKVSNLSPSRQTGTVRLTFANARTGDTVDALLGNDSVDQTFEVAAGESKSYSWRLNVPDEIGFLTYKAVGSTGRLSDGEEGYLPVLSRRILVTESLALPIRGAQTKDFRFDKLADSAGSESLRHQSLTVQMVSNPSWYAVMALPYLMEFPHECSEQLFNRIYANALARKIVNSDPKIERIFEQWRGTETLDSPLLKNEDLKAVMIEETPWYRQAQAESQARRNVAVLFDTNRLNDELDRAVEKLADRQLDDGTWSWFPGGRQNRYITLYIVTGFGRLDHLGVNIETDVVDLAIPELDTWMTEIYEDIKAKDRDKNHLSSTVALYLYGRSFFLKDHPIAAEHRQAIDYWVDQASTHWLKLANRQSQAHLAIALKRFGKTSSARAIMVSIKERSVTDEEMGMFWRDTELSWWWYRAPIETQAMMIEAFDEVMDDQVAVEDCKVWLLKQKQTQDWKTTKATADAVYALLLRGGNELASDEIVTVALGGEEIQPERIEAGTGFYEQRFTGSEISAKQADVRVTKVDDGVAWGSVHWQYMEDIANVTAHEGTPLKLSKQLYVKKNTASGPKLQRVDGPVEVGDELVVRLVLATDRDMEYLHLKDHRGSGTEPVNVLSSYRYQDGLAYYESTRDTASHFFIDYLPKGKYVFEYSTRVQLRGEYQTGLANIQCMYAPEFNSHSESLPIQVQ